jgi:hypothetical protein
MSARGPGIYSRSLEVVRGMTDIATGEVAALQHELRDDAVERAALVAEAFLAGAEGTEVLGGLGDHIVVEVEVNGATVSWISDEVSAVNLQ